MEILLKERYEYVFEKELLEEIIKEGQFRKVRKDVIMIEIGDKLTHMPLILEGAIKIVNEDDTDNEYLLYYLEMGDSCAMTMTCCIGGKKSNIRAVTEKETLMYMIPIHKMEDWLIKYKSWRAFVFDSYDVRMSEMLEAINVLAFQNMEERLYKYLKDRAMVLQSPFLEITHYQIANDLNTSRVVISRLVKKLMIDQKIETNRNKITVLEFLPQK
ncbi:MAG: Crp/Fnr family transcriptional regulator [Saprospiraceae bacterium]|nr:MAG: Crp/Fnr family transcriptional regulator [Saprospiraceae bacterium]